MDVDNLVIVIQGKGVNVVTGLQMGVDWKAWKVVRCSFTVWEKVSHIFYNVFLMTRESGSHWIVLDECYLFAANSELHIWPQLTKDNVQRSYLNSKEDEWLIYDVFFHFWRAVPLMAREEDVGLLLK